MSEYTDKIMKIFLNNKKHEIGGAKMAEYVVGLKGYVIVEADNDEEAIENALNETPDEMVAEILEIHYENQ